MDKSFLLTYHCVLTPEISVDSYQWFNTEDELKKFVSLEKEEEKGFYVKEAIEVKEKKQILF